MMNNNEEIEVQNDVIIDKDRLTRIIGNILELESKNVKSRELSDEDIKKKIDKIIEEEIKCC